MKSSVAKRLSGLVALVIVALGQTLVAPRAAHAPTAAAPAKPRTI
jgi:hypothetical protein